jgi:hypothetical protein
MKKLIGLVVLGLFLGGCSYGIEQSNFWKHDTMYKNSDHMKYSLCGYKDCKISYTKDTQDQGWWGIPKDCKK